MSDVLSCDFYSQETTVVAKKLLGCRLVRKINRKTISGIIIETEAYRSNDPASHTFTGMTECNKAMFGTVVSSMCEYLLMLKSTDPNHTINWNYHAE